MARIVGQTGKLISAKVTRPGVHAKTKTSKSKMSKNYKKANVGQGR